MVATVQVVGLPQLQQRLKLLPVKIQKQVARKSSRAAAKVTLGELKRTVARRSGRLVRSLKVRSLKRSRRRVGVKITTNGIPYAASYEFGNKRGQEGTGAMKRAADGTTAQARQVAVQTAKTEMAKVVNSVGGKSTG